MKLSAILPHYLLKVNAADVNLLNARDDQYIPSWVFEELSETSWVVVRRGVVTRDRIPIGVRGPERSHRWPASCQPRAIQQIMTPPDLLKRFETSEDSHGSPAFRGLRSLVADWQWLTHFWGPGGSVGFELATGKRTVTARSDLDIVIYANERLSQSDALRILGCIRNIPVAVDIRVETPVCGFSLTEYARSSAKLILARTCTGPILTDNPWNADLRSMAIPMEVC
jgi:phosphoribosyl-dephospho-CoA transferase